MIGAGGLGLMCVTILKAMGGKGAVMVDIDARRRAAALEAGALAAIDGAAPDALAQVSAALGGPCWAAIDLVGSPQTAALGFDSLAKGGKMVMVGLFGGAAPWSLPLIPMKAATIRGQLHRQSRRDARTSRSRALRRDAENSDPHAPARARRLPRSKT